MEGFYNQEDIWRLNEELKALKTTQVEQARLIGQHNDRLSRIEARGDDTRIRSLWTSYFPPVPTGSSYTQLNSSLTVEAPAETFDGFDGQQQQTLVTSLPLDEVDVPRRGASRANSVRFDDSAIQNHWTPESHASSEYLPHRTSSSLGGHPMAERSPSYKSDYKSDGRQSSMRSMRSFDNYSMVDSEAGIPLQTNIRATPTTPPVIRCWLGKAFTDDTIHYAVICTGSSKSLIDKSLVSRSGLRNVVWKENGETRISLSLYLADAVVPTERIASQNTLPRLKGEFVVVDIPESTEKQSAIGIVLGSDILSAIQADVMFSRSQMNFLVTDGRTVYVDFAQLGPEMIFPDFCRIGTTRARTMDAGSRIKDFEKTDPEPLKSILSVSSEQGNDTATTTSKSTPSNEIKKTVEEEKPHRVVPTRMLSSSSMGDLQSMNEVSGKSTPSTRDEGKTQRPFDEIKSESNGMNGQYNYSSEKSDGKEDFRNFWESWRKGSDASAKGTASSTDTKIPDATSQTTSAPKPSRPMKVLRTSKSSSSSISNNYYSANENHTPRQTLSTKPFSQGVNGTKIVSVGQRSAPSSIDANTPPSTPAGIQTKPRSSTNVVGGASAFRWMNQSF